MGCFRHRRLVTSVNYDELSRTGSTTIALPRRAIGIAPRIPQSEGRRTHEHQHQMTISRR